MTTCFAKTVMIGSPSLSIKMSVRFISYLKKIKIESVRKETDSDLRVVAGL